MYSRARLLRAGTAGGALGAVAIVLPQLVAPPAVAEERKAACTVGLNERDAKLKLVQVVFRHGARTPLTRREELWKRTGAKWDVCGAAYPAVKLSLTTKDGGPVPPNEHNLQQVSKVLEGGCHTGQLTVAGQLQARDLGQWLRARYVDQYHLLPPTYQEGVIAARTTPYQRTIGTLAGVLTGLLGPPAPGSPAIPAVSSTAVDEILYADTKQCPHLKVFMRLGKENSQRLVRSDPEFEWVQEELVRLGIAEKQSADKPAKWFFTDIHDVVAALTAAGKPIPEGFTPRLTKAINRLATKEFAPTVAPSVNDTYGHPLLKLSMGVLLQKLITNMERAAAAPAPTPPAPPPSPRGAAQAATAPATASATATGPRLYLYSGHDSTIMPVLSALGKDVLDTWPPFLSNVVFELWEVPASNAPSGRRHVVRVLYNREELTDLPHCPPDQYLTLESFKSEVIGPFLISEADITSACSVPVDHSTSKPSVGQEDDE